MEKPMYEKQIAEHISNVNKLLNAKLNRAGYDFLLQLEEVSHKQCESWCNVGYTDDERDDFEKLVFKLICDVLHIDGHEAIIFNGDPRGYALKVCDDFVRKSTVNIYRDMGGYGILVPNFAEQYSNTEILKAFNSADLLKDEVQV